MTSNTLEEIEKFFEGLSDNPEKDKQAVLQHMAECAIVRELVFLRNQLGLSPRELAKKAGMSPGKVARLEAGTDANLRLGDLQSYLCALGYALDISFEPVPPAPKKRQAVASGHSGKA